MTRFARAGKRKFLDASTWNELSENQSNTKPSAVKKDAPVSTKTKKIVSKGKKSLTQERSEKTVLDPKRQKQIEARRLRRKKRKCCFVCRQYGHQASECPNKEDMKIGSCFKCGSLDHTTKNCKESVDDTSSGSFPFAKCFICQEMGHLARSCPENPRGLYPQGGGCKVCGSVEHLKRDCPQVVKKKIKGNVTESVILTVPEGSSHKSADAEDIVENEIPKHKKKHKKSKGKVVHF
ncbi:zinc finger CCHC domain-containing protein 9-like isoform X2 [Dendronephthya gigantea]|uniref:zinc finger CCHC domain-containing protein 9-like isoform X2 n=1 Tax=Dendronephthya gigantea TaxID=151771 RepID=UPI00106A19CA|nr:zinc finger CCHC domain-containing protein 9-like isoform X2 [Dendronephthya gigantea]XP_028406971.1 zinc finger CCHC domain-containing protein 9-like isoform X2 [Dendronephthya gigantea]